MSVATSPRQLFQVGELAGAFVVRDQDWRRKIFLGGLLLLIVHPIGWPVTLGYRKELIGRLISGADPILPEWKGKIWHYFLEGVKAMGVIFGYLSPLYGSLLILLLVNGVTPELTWIYVVGFFLVFAIFSTLSFPLAIIYWTFFSDTFRLPISIALIYLLIFTAIIFFIPAGFLQVSKSGKYASAFNLRAAFMTLRSNFRMYLWAWYHSALMSLSGHLAFPLSPWGVVWCYLGIIFVFNAILEKEPQIDMRASWFEKLRGKAALNVEPTTNRHVFRCVNPSDQEDNSCMLLRFGSVLIPLPRVVANFLFADGK